MVRSALRNPYAIVVMALALLVIGVTALWRMPTDLLPQFKTPAVQILTLYPGMPAEVMEKDITSRLERWTGQSNGIARQGDLQQLEFRLACRDRDGGVWDDQPPRRRKVQRAGDDSRCATAVREAEDQRCVATRLHGDGHASGQAVGRRAVVDGAVAECGVAIRSRQKTR